MGTFVTAVVVAGILAFAVRSVVKDAKSGRSVQCGRDCKHCGGHCH
ncbi:MAG: FeoB-associated Cys-rich membrane protein [Lachnospiraceae bacterium]|nr:FeoB-associated Cys-rich membrane protein [Lachnospiraceae bacterium]